jgi:isopenicillin-N N-acyltransferase-like protein
MSKTLKISVLCFLTGLLLLGCAKKENTQEIVSDTPAATAPELKPIVLEGSPYNRGLVHGKTLKDEINEIVTIWKADLSKASGMNADAFIEQFLSATDFIPAIEKWTPGLMEEVKGISDGSEIDFNTILTFQLMDEVWLYLREINSESCSVLGMSKTDSSPSYVAQNMDLESFRQGFQVLLHIKHDNSDLESFVFTCAGLIITNGMNNKSIGVCVNTVAQLSYSKDGLPVAFVVRGILERTSLEAAVEFVKTVKHASGQNYCIGGPEKVYDFEASASKVVDYSSAPEIHVIYHTNHPLVNDDYNRIYKEFLSKSEEGEHFHPNSYARFQSLDKRLKTAQEIDIETIKSTLSSKDTAENPVCRSYDKAQPFFTFGCTIMVLSESPELHVAPGPPDVTPFQVFRF